MSVGRAGTKAGADHLHRHHGVAERFCEHRQHKLDSIDKRLGQCAEGDIDTLSAGTNAKRGACWWPSDSPARSFHPGR
jgi:hypothetical protein